LRYFLNQIPSISGKAWIPNPIRNIFPIRERGIATIAFKDKYTIIGIRTDPIVFKPKIINPPMNGFPLDLITKIAPEVPPGEIAQSNIAIRNSSVSSKAQVR
jgi:hypothetical protein